MLPGLMAPFLISTIIIFTSSDPGLKKDFFNRLFNLRLIQPRMLPALIMIMPLAVIMSIIISLPFGASTEQFHFSEGFSFTTGFIPVLLLLFLAAAFEELGWRGYAFDSLQSRYTIFTASLLFSVLWSLWHLPLICVKNSYQYEIFRENIWYAVNFHLGIIPMGIIVSWICIKNGKSVLSAILFHFVINISQEILNISQFTKCIETVVLASIAAGIVMKDKVMFFQKNTTAQAGN